MNNSLVTLVFENAAYLLLQESLPYFEWLKQELAHPYSQSFQKIPLTLLVEASG